MVDKDAALTVTERLTGQSKGPRCTIEILVTAEASSPLEQMISDVLRQSQGPPPAGADAQRASLGRAGDQTMAAVARLETFH